MEPHAPKPEIHPPRWYEYALHWSGWEMIYEHRRKVASGVAFCLIFAGFIGWLYARRATSSVQSIMRAERIVNQLTQGPGPDQEEVDAAQETKRMEVLAPVNSQLGRRFSGVIAQEEVLNKLPIDADRFHAAVQELTEAKLPLQALVVEATKLSAENKPHEALQIIETLLSKAKANTNLYTYALLQKASLLRTLNQPNESVITEIKEILSQSPRLSDSLEEWCDETPESLLNYLQN